MEAIIFIGIQGSGKSTFYKDRFFDTHVRINLDMLKTRHRERVLLQACIAAKQSFVVDNTNVQAEQRARYISAATSAGFRVIGYYFRVDAREALRRNSLRTGKALIPVKGILGTLNRLQVPHCREGFDDLYSVHINAANEFVVEKWV